MAETPLQFAEDVTKHVNNAWDSGEFLENVTPTTRTLITYWFGDEYIETRTVNFHEGQRQAILNTVYIHEVLQADNIFEAYQHFAPDLLLEGSDKFSELSKTKYNYPKYAIKMATGTGKTWVLSALLIWQYLNAKYEEGNYSKNFLAVAPGLIVYERLLDAFLGKEEVEGEGRIFEESDIYKLQDLFLPVDYRDEMFGFFKSSTVKKEEIGSKITGDGLIAVTNWHLLAGVEEEGFPNTESLSETKPWEAVKEALPIRPGANAGNDLNTLDAAYGHGKELEYLYSLSDLVVFNDEAHHIHEVRKGQETTEVEWQKSLSAIAESKGRQFIQVDFSATPYNQVGKDKDWFLHIIVDFDLKTAIKKGHVKTLVLDRRKEIATMELDYKAERDENGNPIGLSEGQRVMLRAGLQKLRILEKHFSEVTPENVKYPKMMVVCEDTKVAPFVNDFLCDEGLSGDDVLEIHTDRKGNVSKDEWGEIKHQLFHLDNHPKPRVVVSVLMLREGFDVNNICVVVPLRSTQSNLLLEQTIGRGLRPMWREPEFKDIKEENRKRLLSEKRDPVNYYDLLSIVEHPAFTDFYDELMQGGYVGSDESEIESSEEVIGDVISVPLRDNYNEYDFAFPFIVSEGEEAVKDIDLQVQELHSFYKNFTELKRMIPEGEQFVSQEVTQGARFGDYSIQGGVLTATSYNEYIGRLVDRITRLLDEPLAKQHRKTKTKYPALQIQKPKLAELADTYIRTRLFNEAIDPFMDNNWRVLLIPTISDYVVKELSRAVLKLQDMEVTQDPEVMQRYLSEVSHIRVRESSSVETSKAIYERLPYPAKNGNLEKTFIEYADTDNSIEAFIKILINYHSFVRFRYLKEDGLMAQYYPDFLVRGTNGKIYIVEAKADEQVNHPNVQKKRIAVLDWTDRINQLPAHKRSNCEWHYVILGEEFFYDWRDKRASVVEMLEFAKLRPASTTNEQKNLFSE